MGDDGEWVRGGRGGGPVAEVFGDGQTDGERAGRDEAAVGDDEVAVAGGGRGGGGGGRG